MSSRPWQGWDSGEGRLCGGRKAKVSLGWDRRQIRRVSHCSQRSPVYTAWWQEAVTLRPLGQPAGFICTCRCPVNTYAMGRTKNNGNKPVGKIKPKDPLTQKFNQAQPVSSVAESVSFNDVPGTRFRLRQSLSLPHYNLCLNSAKQYGSFWNILALNASPAGIAISKLSEGR